MDKCYSLWVGEDFGSSTGEPHIMEELTRLKVVCKECKNRELFMNNYDAFIKSYKRKGAIFMGVAGGKLSEGIDFTDDMARMVILVGIPFGNRNDLKIKAKQAYLDERFKKTTKTHDVLFH